MSINVISMNLLLRGDESSSIRGEGWNDFPLSKKNERHKSERVGEE
jgi:hypothetical protein